MSSTPANDRGLRYTRHARQRMQQRALAPEDVLHAMIFGREVHAADAVLYVVGRREVARWRADGVRIDDLEGVHVLCSTAGVVITAYRNKQLDGYRRLRHAA